MKRLIKKAWGSIELYHFTSAQLFMRMMEDGQIVSGGYNNIISSGGHFKVYGLPNDNTENNVMKTLDFLIDVRDGVNKGDVIFSKELSNYIEQMLDDGYDGDEKIKVNISNPSHNEIGVYLTDSQYDMEGYLSQSLNSNNNDNLPNFGIVLKVEVQTDALIPDYDDLRGDTNFNSDSPLWKQSLDRIGQVVHNGPIDTSSIVAVDIATDNGDYEVGKRFERNRSDILDWFSSKLTLNRWISPNEAFNQLQQMYQEYQDLTPENLKQLI